MKLRVGYLISAIATGFILLLSFLTSLPDGNLHIVFCNVGQGDAAYIRFPDGRDMLVDGGPNNTVLGCLSDHMPFYDRSLDLVVLTHPQRDHLQGLIEVAKRFRVGHFIKSDVANTSEGYAALTTALADARVPIRLVTQGETIRIDKTVLSILWPSGSNVLGVSSTATDPNDYSVVLHLRYGTFDAVLTGDADTRVEAGYRDSVLANDGVEVLKVPHHGSKTGMSEAFVDWLRPQLAVISVGNNTYGHPAPEIIRMLESRGARVVRTDTMGDIEIISDGVGWKIISP